MACPWRFSIDRGGTFTDVVAVDPQGISHTAKLLSEAPGVYEDAAIEAVRRLTGAGQGELPDVQLRIGTTIATNALLERKGEPVALAITKGFRDALWIGTQERPELFARRIARPDPLYDRVVEIEERVAADGDVLHPVDRDAARRALQAAYEDGYRALAIVLLHGAAFPAHERSLVEIAEEIGFPQVSVSHAISPTIRLIGRGTTTVADAYLSPVLRRYVEGIEKALGKGVTPLFMQSSGALADSDAISGKDAILSGPAGGIVGMARTAEAAGFSHVVGFDMGGTSTDVSYYDGSFARDGETVVAGQRIRTPMMRIHTVAAGGGSICALTGGRFTVGPESAGAVPGPACYRRGGPLTVTDCNVILGKLQPRHFPTLFGPDGDQPLDAAASAVRFDELASTMRDLGLNSPSPEDAASGFIAIAVANMARAIRKISIERGHDITGAALACFGGAAGQHACLVADALGLERVMIHPLAGVLSAHGIGLADRGVVRDRTCGLALAGSSRRLLETMVDALRSEAIAALPPGDVRVRVTAHVRYGVSENVIELPFGTIEAMHAEFEKIYRRRFGFAGSGGLVVETLRVEAFIPSDAPPDRAPVGVPNPRPIDHARAYLAGQWHDMPIFVRDRLPVGFSLSGPAMITDPVATTIVEPGWRLDVDPLGNFLLSKEAVSQTIPHNAESDPVRLEIFGGLFTGLAEEMGAALQQSAASVNIRERLDFSCALFDASGALVANAPHMPVHLGSMGDSITAIVEERGGARDGRGILPGDAYALNAPYRGGTHLPDITVVAPVFCGSETPAFYVAARGHHADIGGIAPGSMPPNSRDVREEGILLDNVLIAEGGTFLEQDVRTRLGEGQWPARDPDRNIADLKAQLAACVRGAEGLQRLARDHGLGVVQAYMGHLQANAEAAVRAEIDKLSDGDFAYEMDDGAIVRVAIRIDRQTRSATVDFTGTSPQQPGNFNAPKSITRAAVLYAFRTLVDAPIPMNDGCLAPIEIIVPEGCMLNPRFPAAVVAGNVETSQVVTDAIFGALGAMAAAQGTMNNFTFGNARHQYYETIAGGSGAGPGFDGTDVVQTHMTNSRLTDPEILETRFPVRLEAFDIREGSGGTGRWTGGNGARRRIRFLEPMQAGILANRRRVPPFGLACGGDGAPGRNWVERQDGAVEMLGATGSVDVEAGDVFVIETPGGGGYGQ